MDRAYNTALLNGTAVIARVC